MVILPLVYSLVLIATTLADNGYAPLKPDGRCKFVGQYLSHPGSRCMYVRCDYGNEPWHDSYGKVKLFGREMECAPGTSVPEYFDSAKKQGNPCTLRTNGGHCKGSYTYRTTRKQHGAYMNQGGFKSPFYGGLVGLRGKMTYPEPRQYKGHAPFKPETYERKVDYTEQRSPETDHDSGEEYYSKEEFPHNEKYLAKEDYQSKGDHGPQEEYIQRRDYIPKRDYQPKDDYKPKKDYPERGDYHKKGDNPQRGDYHKKGDNPQRGDYHKKGDSPRKGDYPMKGDYAPMREYRPRREYFQARDTFPKEEYSSKGDSSTEDDYPDMDAYPPTYGYSQKGDYSHNYPDDNVINSQKGAIFPPGDHHVGDKYDSMANSKGFEFMHEDFKKDFSSPFRGSLPRSNSDYSPPRGRYVMRGAREAPAGPYPQTEELFPPTESSEEETEDASREINSPSSGDKVFLDDDGDDFTSREEDDFGSSENDVSQGESLSDFEGGYHPLNNRYRSPSEVLPHKQNGFRLSKTAFPFLKDALVALKKSFPDLKDSDPLDGDSFTSKENSIKENFPPDFQAPPEMSDFGEEERSRYEGPTFQPAVKLPRDLDSEFDTEQEYPMDRDD